MSKKFSLKQSLLVSVSSIFVASVVFGALASISSSSIDTLAVVAGSSSSSSSTCTTFTDVGDSYVFQDMEASYSNFGTTPQMNIGSPVTHERRGYVSFNTAALTGTVTSAKITLNESPATGMAGGQYSFGVRAANTGWSESTVTFNNQPALSPTVLGTFAGVVAEAQSFDINLTDFSTISNGATGFVITNSSTQDIDLAAREQGVNTAPKLVVCSTPTSSSATTSSMANSQSSSQSQSLQASNNNGKPTLNIGTTTTAESQGGIDGNTLNFTGIKLSDGSLLTSYPVQINITTPDGTNVVLSTTCDSSGNVSIFIPKQLKTASIFDIFGSIDTLAAGTTNYTFVSGSLANLTAPGNYSSYMTLSYNGVTYYSPVLGFSNGNPIFNAIGSTVRSGGLGISTFIGISIVAMFGYFGYSSLRNSDK